jgi:hypothetical protein
MLSIIFHIFVYVKHFMHNYAVFYEYYALFMQAIKPLPAFSRVGRGLPAQDNSGRQLPGNLRRSAL